MGLKVWIDQDLCTGDGLCEEISPAVFTLLDDGLAYVKDAQRLLRETSLDLDGLHFGDLAFRIGKQVAE